MERCSNCNETFKTGEQIKPDGKGGWRHPSKCGSELIGLKVVKSDWRKLADER